MACIKCGKKAYEAGFCREHFVEYLEKKVRYTIRKFSLLGKGERIAVAASGGKDSTTVLYMLKKFGYDVEAFMVEPGIKGYTDENARVLAKVCEDNAIPLTVISVKDEFGRDLAGIQGALRAKGVEMQDCAVCGVLKRYLLNKACRGFDVVATGHTMDDEAQAFLMNVFRNDTKQVYRGGPRNAGGQAGDKFVPRIKPLYLCKEGETRAYSKALGFPVNYGRCPCSRDAYRKNFRDFLDAMEAKHPNVKDNVVQFYLSEFYGMGLDDGRARPSSRAGSAPKLCSECGEPSSGGTCKACQIIGHLKAY